MGEGIIDSDKIELHSVSVYKSVINVSEGLLGFEPQVEYSFSYALETQFNEEEKLVMIRLNVLLDAGDEQGKALDIMAEFGIQFVFEVENFMDFVTKLKDGNAVDSILGSTLIGIAFSTARGIILGETQKSVLGGILLPIVNPNDLIPELIE